MQQQIKISEQDKRQKFIAMLLYLASSEILFKDDNNNNILNCYQELDDIYYIDDEHCFRHFYSDIYSTLRFIKSNVQFGTIAYLLQNIEILRVEFHHFSNKIKIKTQKLEECLKKIYDHTSLEIARMDDSDGRDRDISLKSSMKEMENNINEKNAKLENKISKLENELKEEEINITLNYNYLNENYNELKSNHTKLNNKIEGYQKEYVGILSIFAAVIVAFTAGTAFSSSVLNNIDNVTIYRLVFTCLLLGGVLINVLYMLFSFVLIIIKGHKLDIKICITVNIVIVFLLGLTVYTWDNGYIEKRNKNYSIEKQHNLDKVVLTKKNRASHF